ncbi:unnamed protein product [Polarella glacialis]|uniref:Uncharacterized protein n=2 Tax=Polarella glacialis TaxID=89957 RepID=A0A813L727_POLGL|nr:unnamed protein product [Polarella glacialis]
MPQVPDAGHPSMTGLSNLKAPWQGGISFGRSGVGAGPGPASPRRQTFPVSGSAVPGPGAYSPQLSARLHSPRACPVTSFGSTSTGRLEAAGKPITPGPGTYEPQSSIDSTTSREARRSRRSSDVGSRGVGFGSGSDRPVAISPRQRSASPDSSSGTLSRRSEWFGSSPTTVGPGAYSPTGLAKSPKSLKFSASSRFADTRAPSPGPGSYEQTKSPGAAFRSSDRGLRFSEASPRPSLAKVCRSSKSMLTPGPGSYELASAGSFAELASAAGVASARRTKGYTIGVRAKETSERSPGPGDYGGHYTQFK